MSNVPQRSPQPAPPGTVRVRGPIDPVEVAGTYRLAIVLVGGLLVLLVGLYGAMVLGLGWLTFRTFSVSFWSAMGLADNAANLLTKIGWILPATLVLFLIKPIFAPRYRATDPISLDARAQGRLFEALHTLCEAVGAPTPTQVDIDVHANASAGFRSGVLSMFGNDLVLTIGLPLAAGMSVRQLSGVIAHELGHFSQGGAMRVGYLINRIINWFARVAYERDAWDVRLRMLPLILRLPIEIPLLLTRLVLVGFAIFAAAMGSYLARQMEFDADAHEVAMSGSDCFEKTTESMVLLNFATGRVLSDVDNWWAERRLPDDLARLIASAGPRLERAEVKKALEQYNKERSKLLATHPPDAQRIQRARELEREGVLTGGDAPASSLFDHFEELCRQATYAQYKAMFGDDMFENTFVPTDGILRDQQAFDNAIDRLSVLFDKDLLKRKPLFPAISYIEAPEDPKACARDVVSLGKRLREQKKSLDEHVQPYVDLFDRADRVATVQQLRAAGVRFKASDFDVTRKDASDPNGSHAQLTSDLATCQRRFDPYDENAKRYLDAAMRLLEVPAIQAQIPEVHRERRQLDAVLTTMAGLRDTHRSARAVWEHGARVSALFGYFSKHERSPKYYNKTRRSIEDFHRAQQSMYGTFRSVDYPFEHERGQMTCAGYLLEAGVPHEDDPVALLYSGQQMIDRYDALYWRCIGRIVHAATEVERALRRKASTARGTGAAPDRAVEVRRRARPESQQGDASETARRTQK